MTKEVNNSHYVARHLTTPWEFGQRKLWVYDFELDRFTEQSSKSLLTLQTPWDDEIERFLNRFLESPLSSFLKKFNPETKREDIPDAALRALKLAVLLQRHRSADNADFLKKLVDGGEQLLDTLMIGAEEAYTFMHIPVRKSFFCFPAEGLVVVPFLEGRPGVGVPFHPSHMTVAVPNPSARFVNQLKKYQESQHVIAYLAVGTRSRRVIVPGTVRGNGEEKVRAWLKHARKRAGEITRQLVEETERRKSLKT